MAAEQILTCVPSRNMSGPVNAGQERQEARARALLPGVSGNAWIFQLQPGCVCLTDCLLCFRAADQTEACCQAGSDSTLLLYCNLYSKLETKPLPLIPRTRTSPTSREGPLSSLLLGHGADAKPGESFGFLSLPGDHPLGAREWGLCPLPPDT